MRGLAVAFVTTLLLVPVAVSAAPAPVLPSAPESSVYFSGNGQNVIYIDWENDVVAVIRWIRGGDALNNVVGTILASIEAPPRQAAR